jgi:NAD-dependent SIR2 family protein deacetylase
MLLWLRKQGVWTLEKHGRPLPADFVDFEHAVPSPTHMAIVALHRAGYISYVVTQNVDGLHLKVRHNNPALKQVLALNGSREVL